jgi:type II secretory pathway component PulF
MNLSSFFKWQLFGRPGARDIIILSRELATMIKAGVPLVQAFEMLIRQSTKPILTHALEDIARSIEGGNSLSMALSRHPQLFNSFYLGVIQSGEASGRLTHSFETLADFQEQDYIFRRKIQTALTYPAVILVAIIIVMIIIFAVIMPQLVQLFADAEVQLPWATRLVIGLADFFRSFWYVLFFLSLILFVIGRSYARTPEGSYVISSTLLRIPGLSGLLKKMYLTRLTSVLHTLFDSDVPVIETLKLARKSMNNKVYERIMTNTLHGVKNGATISSLWEREPHIPPLLIAIVSVGERSGELSQAFAQAQTFFVRDVDNALNTIAILLEPIMVILLGIGVTIIVASVLLPIYNLVLVF